MSIARSTVAQPTAVGCGKCGHANANDAKFCGGCGHAIFEPCSNCNASVRLTQKFCGQCGTDLEVSLQRRIAQIRQSLVDAIAAAKEHDYDSAISRLKTLAANSDYRFATFAGQAQLALPKVIKLRDQIQQNAEASQIEALAAHEMGDHARVIELLAKVPAKLLQSQASEALAQSVDFVNEVDALKAELREAASNKDWLSVGLLLERVLDLFPDDEGYSRFAGKVSAKLISLAEKHFAKCEYDEALEHLNSVPSDFHNDDYRSTKHRIATVHWLTTQLTTEPFATPALGKLAVRLTQESPGDPRGPEMVKKLAAAIQSPLQEASSLYPPWMSSRESVLGGGVSIYGWPQSIELGNQTKIQQHPARFGVAFGLALQALGESCFSTGFTQKKSLLGQLAIKRAPTTAWGLDIGTSSVKAVQLRREGGKLLAVDSHLFEYPEVVRAGRDDKAFAAMRDLLKDMISKIDLKTSDYWVNYPSREILARFVELPPVDNKKAAQLLDLEATQAFPVNQDELEVLKWVADKPERMGVGRHSVLIAVRKLIIQRRWDFLAEIGLKPTGMQCESMALMNLIWREFNDIHEPSDASASVVPALAVVDAGATSTTVCIVASKRLWFRTIDGGGEDITLALSRSAKIVRDEAERLKKSPHELPLPAIQYHAIEEKHGAACHRIKQLIAEMLREHREVKVVKTLVTGGACLGYGWIQRAICNR